MMFDWHGLLTGRWSKEKFSALYFPIIFLALCCWTIARVFYPLDNWYCIDVCRISRQGNMSTNPVGGWFFIISTAITGLFFIFYFIFAYRRLLGNNTFLARLFLFWGCVSGIGLFLVGVCPEGSRHAVQTMHDVGDGMAFGGSSHRMAARSCRSAFAWSIRPAIRNEARTASPIARTYWPSMGRSQPGQRSRPTGSAPGASTRWVTGPAAN